jgi:cell division protein FtsB
MSNIVWVGIACYFTYHMFIGARGIVSWTVLSREIEKLEKELNSLRDENSFLENKIKRLRTNSLDLDLLEEQALNILGFSNEDDIIVLLPKY